MRTILTLLATILATGGCGGSPVAPDAPDRTDCGLFSDRATSPFVLPFESGQAFLAGRTIEHGDPQRYAIDWIMPTNTSVIAARAGRVVAAERQWNDTDHTFGHENHIFVQHEDGTVARYFHLTPGGVFVAIGEPVRQGQRIAHSGNSGNSSGPHLHFDVVEAACSVPWPGELDGRCQWTVPITFRNTRPHACGIRSLETYLAE